MSKYILLIFLLSLGFGELCCQDYDYGKGSPPPIYAIFHPSTNKVPRSVKNFKLPVDAASAVSMARSLGGSVVSKLWYIIKAYVFPLMDAGITLLRKSNLMPGFIMVHLTELQAAYHVFKYFI